MANEAKYTPGPWVSSRHDQFGTSLFYVAQADDATYTPHYSDVATLIAETCSGELLGIQAANARLIAAAPELLDAVGEALELVADLTESARFTDRVQALEASWRAAIAKATGSAQ